MAGEAGEISSIGVKLTLDASQFMTGMDAAKTKTQAFSSAATAAAKAKGQLEAGGGKNAAPSHAAQNMGIDVSLTINDAAISGLRRKVQAGLQNIPVSITPTFAETGKFSLPAIMGSMLSMQYGVTNSQGRTAALQTIERMAGSLPIKKAAAGGPVPANRPVIVGEHRPEVIVPRTPSIIHPSVQSFYREQELARQRELELVLVERARQQQHDQRIQTAMRGRMVRRQDGGFAGAPGHAIVPIRRTLGRLFEKYDVPHPGVRPSLRQRTTLGLNEVGPSTLPGVEWTDDPWMPGGRYNYERPLPDQPYRYDKFTFNTGKLRGQWKDIAPPGARGPKAEYIATHEFGHYFHTQMANKGEFGTGRSIPGKGPTGSTGLDEAYNRAMATDMRIPPDELWGLRQQWADLGSGASLHSGSVDARLWEGVRGLPSPYSRNRPNEAEAEYFAAVERQPRRLWTPGTKYLAEFFRAQQRRGLGGITRAATGIFASAMRPQYGSIANVAQAERMRQTVPQLKWWNQQGASALKGVGYPVIGQMPLIGGYMGDVEPSEYMGAVEGTPPWLMRQLAALGGIQGQRLTEGPMGHATQEASIWAAVGQQSMGKMGVSPNARQMSIWTKRQGLIGLDRLRRDIGQRGLAGGYSISQHPDRTHLQFLMNEGMLSEAGGEAAMSANVRDLAASMGGTFQSRPAYMEVLERTVGAAPYMFPTASYRQALGSDPAAHAALKALGLIAPRQGGGLALPGSVHGKRLPLTWQAFGHEVSRSDVRPFLRNYNAMGDLALTQDPDLYEFAGNIWYPGRRRALLEGAKARGALPTGQGFGPFLRAARSVIPAAAAASPGLTDARAVEWAQALSHAGADPAFLSEVMKKADPAQVAQIMANVKRKSIAREVASLSAVSPQVFGVPLSAGKYGWEGISKAWDIARGAVDWRDVLATSDKVYPFTRNTAGNEWMRTIDSHDFDIAGGGTRLGSRLEESKYGNLSPTKAYPRGRPSLARATVLEAARLSQENFASVWPSMRRHQAGLWVPHFPITGQPVDAALTNLIVPKGWRDRVPPGYELGPDGRLLLPSRQGGGLVRAPYQLDMVKPGSLLLASHTPYGHVPMRRNMLSEQMASAVDQIRNQPIEHALTFDEKGGFLGHAIGEEGSVTPSDITGRPWWKEPSHRYQWSAPWARYIPGGSPQAQLNLVGTTSVHNHPVEMGPRGPYEAWRPSPDDVMTMLNTGQQEGWNVTPRHTFIMRPGEAAISTLPGRFTEHDNPARTVLNRLRSSVGTMPTGMLEDLINSRRYTTDAKFWHDAMRDVSEQFDIQWEHWYHPRQAAGRQLKLPGMADGGDVRYSPAFPGRGGWRTAYDRDNTFGVDVRDLHSLQKEAFKRLNDWENPRYMRRLSHDLTEEGIAQPIDIRLGSDGAPYIHDGNHRVAAALRWGGSDRYLPATISNVESSTRKFLTPEDVGLSRIGLDGRKLRFPKRVDGGFAEALRAVEAKNRRLPYEVATFLDPWSGRTIFEKSGLDNMVDLNELFLPGATGVGASVMTHNHPSGFTWPTSDPRRAGNSFSPNDIKMAYSLGLHEVRATTPRRTYSLRPSAERFSIFDPSEESMVDWDLVSKNMETRTKLERAIAEGTMTPAQASATHWHRVMQDFAKGRGLNYRSLPFGKRAGGGRALEGVYLVGEIGPELFVPDEMAPMIPKKVMDQIPKAKGGMQVIGTRRDHDLGGELFFPPTDGVIIPNRLMDQVPHAARGTGAFEVPDWGPREAGNLFSHADRGAAWPRPEMGPRGNEWATIFRDVWGRITRERMPSPGDPMPTGYTPGAPLDAGRFQYMPSARWRDWPAEDRGLPPSGSFQATEGPMRDALNTPAGGGLWARGVMTRNSADALDRLTAPGTVQAQSVNVTGQSVSLQMGTRPIIGGRPAGIGSAPGGGGVAMPPVAGGSTPRGATPTGALAAPPVPVSYEGQEFAARFEESLKQREVELFRAGASTSTRTPQGMIAMMSANFGGGLARQQAAVKAAREAETAMRKATAPFFDTEAPAAGKGYEGEALAGGDLLKDYLARLDDLALAHKEDRGEIEKNIKAMEEQQPKLEAVRKAREKETEAAKLALPGMREQAFGLAKVVGGIQLYGLAMQGIGFAMSAVQPVLRDWVDEVRGFRSISEQTTGSLAEQARASSGNVEAVMNQAAASRYLGSSLADLGDGMLTQNVAVKAGAENAKAIEDWVKTIVGAGSGVPAGTYGGFGGPLFESAFLGKAGGAEAIAGAFSAINVGVQGSEGWREGNALEQAAGSILEAVQSFGNSVAPDLIPKPEEEIKPTITAEQAADIRGALAADLNAAAARGGKKYDTGRTVEFVADAGMSSVIKDLETVPAELRKLAEEGVVVMLDGNLVATQQQADKALPQAVAGLSIMEPGVWAKEAARVMSAQWEGSGMGQWQTGDGTTVRGLARREMDIGIPFSQWQSLVQNPLISPRAGVSMLGASGSAQAYAERRFAGAAQGQGQIERIANEGLTAQKAEIANFFGVGSEEVQIFGQATSKAQGLSDSIAKLTTDMLNAQQAAADVSYANQIRLATRALADAVGMLGQAGGSRLGYLQREQWLTSRASQSLGLASQEIGLMAQKLSLALQARQIATNLALAQFQAPGETGEERYVRQREAIIRAGIEKQQLGYSRQQYGISEEQFGLSQQQFKIAGEIWAISAQRAAVDAAKTIEVMQASRSAQLKATSAQREIAEAQRRMGVWLQRAANVATRATNRNNDMVAAITSGITATGEQFQLLAVALRGALDTLNGQAGEGGRTDDYIGRTNRNTTSRGTDAAGMLGTFNTPTQATFGEAGSETVAILRNPRTGMLSRGGGGGPTTININMGGVSVRSDDDIDRLANKVARVVERSISRKGELLGLRQPAY